MGELTIMQKGLELKVLMLRNIAGRRLQMKRNCLRKNLRKVSSILILWEFGKWMIINQKGALHLIGYSTQTEQESGHMLKHLFSIWIIILNGE